MCKFISRVRSGKGRQQTVTHGLLNRDRYLQWCARWFETTGKHPTNQDLLDELDSAIEEYNKTTKARIVQ